MIKVAVIGCGYWGPNLIRNFHSISECWVKVVCDIDSHRLTHMESLYSNIETTTDLIWWLTIQKLMRLL